MTITLTSYPVAANSDVAGLKIRCNGADLDLGDPSVSPFIPSDKLNIVIHAHVYHDRLLAGGVLLDGEECVLSVSALCRSTLFRQSSRAVVYQSGPVSVQLDLPSGLVLEQLELSIELSRHSEDWGAEAFPKRIWQRCVAIGLGGSLSQPRTESIEFSGNEKDAFWKFVIDEPFDFQELRSANHQHILTIQINKRHEESLAASHEMRKLLAANMCNHLLDWLFTLDEEEVDELLQWCEDLDDPEVGSFVRLLEWSLRSAGLDTFHISEQLWRKQRTMWQARLQNQMSGVIL